MPAVPYSIVLDGKIGYIPLEVFNENAAAETQAAIRELQQVRRVERAGAEDDVAGRADRAGLAALLDDHASPMGITSVGSTLYGDDARPTEADTIDTVRALLRGQDAIPVTFILVATSIGGLMRGYVNVFDLPVSEEEYASLTEQVVGHASVFVTLPSSQASPACMTPSPHSPVTAAQSAAQ